VREEMHLLANQEAFYEVYKRSTCGIGVEVGICSRGDEVYYLRKILTVYELKVQAIRKDVGERGMEEMSFNCMNKVRKSFIKSLGVACEVL